MGSFKAKERYKDLTVVREYDDVRFTSLKGRLTDYFEKKLIMRAIAYCDLQTGSSILDIPCGTGRLSVVLMTMGYAVTGSDVSEAMVQRASDKAAILKVGSGSFCVMDAEHINAHTDAFDAVISLRFLGHTPVAIRKNIINEFKRVSKKWIICGYYDRGSVKEILRRNKRSKNDVPWYSANLRTVKEELASLGVKFHKAFYLLKGISETFIVVGEVKSVSQS